MPKQLYWSLNRRASLLDVTDMYVESLNRLMRRVVESTKMPSPPPSVKKNIAYNNRVPPVSEMRHRTEEYEKSYSPYEIKTEVNSGDIIIDFRNGRFRENIRIPKQIKDKETYNPAFGKYRYNLRLISISLKSSQSKMSEFIETTYWGTVNDNNAGNFVKKNARIVKSRYVLKPKYSTNITNRFTCTDINAYTKGRLPNPWCRDSILLLYEKSKYAKNIKNHPKLGVKKSKFSTIYSSDLIKSSYVY